MDEEEVKPVLPTNALENFRLEGIKEESNAGSPAVLPERIEASPKLGEHEPSPAPSEVSEEELRRIERRAARRKEREERQSRRSPEPSEVSEVHSNTEAQQLRHERRESRLQEQRELEDGQAKETQLAPQSGRADSMARPSKDEKEAIESGGSSTATPTTAAPSSPGGIATQLSESQKRQGLKPMEENEVPQEEELVRGAERRWQEEIDNLKRQAQRSSQSRRPSMNIPSRYQASEIPDDAVE